MALSKYVQFNLIESLLLPLLLLYLICYRLLTHLMHWLPTSVCLSSIHPLSVPWLYQRMHAALHNRGGGHRRSTCHPLSDRIDSASASAYQPIYLGFGVAVTAPFSGKYSHRPAFYYSDDTLLFTWVVLIMKLMLHHLLAPSESHTIIWFLYIFYFNVVSSRLSMFRQRFICGV